MENLIGTKVSEKIILKVEKKSKELFDESYKKLCEDNDKVFGLLLGIQWVAAVLIAMIVSPKTWIGAQDLVSVHIYASIIIGGLLTLFPLYLIHKEPGAVVNRYANVIAQALYSVLFIHLTGGRIETHFHVFGSLAFFAFYRDVRLLIVGSLIVTVDHFIRGTWFPVSAFGILNVSNLRWLEHAGWVIFEDFFLTYACVRGMGEMKLVAKKTAEVMAQHEFAEELVEERANTIQEQQMQLIHSAKMSSLGMMAAGIAHEINNPLTVISSSNKLMHRLYTEGDKDLDKATRYYENIDKTVKRISNIILGLRTVSRDATGEQYSAVKIRDLMNDVLGLCGERFKNNGVNLIIDFNDPVFDSEIQCRRVQMSQVFINLLGNAFDAVEDLDEKWVKVECNFVNNFLEFRVSDSGKGIPKDIQEKIFQPFFTTKPLGKGTGLGLSLSFSIINDHDGMFKIDSLEANTCFVISLPARKQQMVS